MSNDISESVSQRGYGAETPQNRRIYEISDELHRRCQLYEAKSGTSQANGGCFFPVLMQRRIRNASPATQIMIDTYMSALGFTKENDEKTSIIALFSEKDVNSKT